MTPDHTAADCFVCRKHRDRGSLIPGGAVAQDDLVLVSHSSPDAPGSRRPDMYLGHLFVEPLRHAPGLADLTGAEARAVGGWCTRASRALIAVAGAEHVYAAVIGDAVPHLHVHLIPRYPYTPPEYRWMRVTDWPQAPRGGHAEIGLLVGRPRHYPERVVTVHNPAKRPKRRSAPNTKVSAIIRVDEAHGRSPDKPHSRR